jgi:hypothetical protein
MAKNGTEPVSISLPGNIIDLTDKCAGILLGNIYF